MVAFTSSVQALSAAEPTLNVAPFSGSSLQFIGTAEGLARKVQTLVNGARTANHAVICDRHRANERVYEKLGQAEVAVFELLDAILKARAAVAPAEEA